MKRSRPPHSKSLVPTNDASIGLFQDVRELILTAREQVAQTVNTGLVALYWQIGYRIRRDILKEKRAEYGEKIVSALGRQLTAGFGRGFSARNLASMVRFAEVFPDLKILQSLTAKSPNISATRSADIPVGLLQADGPEPTRMSALLFRNCRWFGSPGFQPSFPKSESMNLTCSPIGRIFYIAQKNLFAPRSTRRKASGGVIFCLCLTNP